VAAYDRRVSDVEHQLLMENAEHLELIASLRASALRAAHSAIAAQDHADGTHERWLDDLVDELTASAER
jgi:hypothetical protein